MAAVGDRKERGERNRERQGGNAGATREGGEKERGLDWTDPTRSSSIQPVQFGIFKIKFLLCPEIKNVVQKFRKNFRKLIKFVEPKYIFSLPYGL